MQHKCFGVSPLPAGCEHVGQSDRWPPYFHHLKGKTGGPLSGLISECRCGTKSSDGGSQSHLWAPRCLPASWLARCTAQRPAWQIYCTVWWRLRCPCRAQWCLCGAAAPAVCLSLCPRRFSYPGAAGENSRDKTSHSFSRCSNCQHRIPTNTDILKRFTSSRPKKKEKKWTCFLTWRSSLSAKDMIPSNMITLAPYTFFCTEKGRAASVQRHLMKR